MAELTFASKKFTAPAGVSRRSFFAFHESRLKRFFTWLFNVAISAVIIATLAFIIINFYLFSSITSLDSYLYVFIALSFLIDGLVLFMHMPRRWGPHKKVSFDSSKITILITCYNGEDVIEETIRAASRQVPLNQIMVVSDASTDKSAEIARRLGATVLVNPRNVHKAFSVSRAIQRVKTPYVLLLDDDTLIDKTFIPTSLLDDGYTAVSFNVMPVKEDNFLNAFQRFEYRKSMQIAKNLRASVGAIGNVSGAIGLFHTQDIIDQVKLHSGEFGGEDEQRTTLAHLYGTGRGITYTDSIVETKPPNTIKALYRQRALSWDTSVPELFILNWRLLLHPKAHYLLKAEKASQMYVFLTDPLRILFIYLIFAKPARIFAIYGFYVVMSLAVWLKTRWKDPLWVVLLFPFYNLFTTFCRFVAHFHWFRLKAQYIFKKKYHRVVKQRHMLLEYGIVFGVVVVLWTTSIMQFNSDLQLLRRIQANRLDSYNGAELQNQTIPSLETQASKTGIGAFYTVSVAPSDTSTTLAYKAIEYYVFYSPETTIPDDKKRIIVERLEGYLATLPRDKQTVSLRLESQKVNQAVQEGLIGQQAKR